MIAQVTSLFDLFSRFWNALQHGAVLPLGYWNYLILFIFVIIQGPLTKLLGGAVVATTFLNLYLVIVVSILASLTADVIWFRVGTSGNIQHVMEKRPPKQRRVIEALQRAMQKHYFKILLIGKLSMGMAIPAILAAGISKLSWKRWLPAVMLGEVLYTSMLILVGFFAAKSIREVDDTLQIIGLGVTVIMLVFLVIYLPMTLKKIIKENSQPQELGTTD